MIQLLLRKKIHVLIIYALLVFPIFYFVYKFGILLKGYDDAKWYLKMYFDLTSDEVPSPFNMRLISASIIHCMQSLGLHYHTECAIDAFPLVDKSFFFNNILFNFACITLTAFSLFIIFVKLGFGQVLSFIAGTLYTLGFGSLFYLMMPGPDALSVLIFTWILFFYIKKSYWLIPLFILLIFQREYYFLAFMVIAFMDFIKYKREKYYLFVLLINISCFILYYVLRKTIFHTHHWSHQTSPTFLFSSLLDNHIEIIPMIRQSLMTMNLFFIYLFILAYKYYFKQTILKHHLYVSLIALLQITLLSFAATFGNNNGRYFYLLAPLILYYLLSELKPLLENKLIVPQA
ncbi:MAG: hypothetical protein IPM51_02625 [Sphingobacteriaceae bacterium]|nr:hypothetical protein [Sphingobacteriaceae bacterium]